jgi:rhodanese-related sulfurtransferase
MKLIFLLLTAGLVSCGSAKEETKKSDSESKEETSETESVESTEAPGGNITLLDVESFEKQIANEGTILDVRTPAEVAEGTIANATVIDFNGADFSEQIKSLDKTKPVYVYCKAGGRSGKASEMLASLGYEVYDLDGGMDAWKAAGKSVAK